MSCCECGAPAGEPVAVAVLSGVSPVGRRVALCDGCRRDARGAWRLRLRVIDPLEDPALEAFDRRERELRELGVQAVAAAIVEAAP